MGLDDYDLLKIPGIKTINEESIKRIKFSGVSIDSRKCKASELFAAIKGEKFDGHDFVKDVLKRGVKAVLVNKKWMTGPGKKVKSSFQNKTFFAVEDTLKSLGELAKIYRDKFLIPVIAVGGSNGKTTTKDFVAFVLSKTYSVHNTEGNYNNAIGVPLTVLNLTDKDEMSVVEIGTNHFGEIKNLCGIVKPQFGLLTNIGREHLEFLRNLNGVTKEEFELVSYLETNFGTFFLNGDDPVISRARTNRTLKIFSFGTKKGNDVTGKIAGFVKFSPIAEIRYGNQKVRTRLSMIGTQSFNSALCAAAAGFYFGVPAGKIKKALSEFTISSSRRNELVQANGYYIIDDTYNSNPDSVKIALENMKSYRTGGEKHIVLSDMLELGKTSIKEHRNIGKLVKKLGFKNLYTYGKESYNTYTGAKGVKNNYYFPEKGTLIEFLETTVKKNDIILVKGSRSMKMEEVAEAIKKIS